MKVSVIQFIICLSCTFFFFTLALYRVRLESVGSALAHANPTWIGAAIVAYAVMRSIRPFARGGGRSSCTLRQRFCIGLWKRPFSSDMD